MYELTKLRLIGKQIFTSIENYEDGFILDFANITSL